jgi:SAM-dependent methyltransferase
MIEAIGPPVGLEAAAPHPWRFRLTLPPGGPPAGAFRVLARWATYAGVPLADPPPTEAVLPGPLPAGPPRDVLLSLATPAPPGDYLLEAAFDPGGGRPPAACRTAVTVFAPRAKDIDYRVQYSTADLASNHWWIVGAFHTRAEYERSAAGAVEMVLANGVGPDSRVLDVGCGTGRMAGGLERVLSDAGRYVGTEIAPEAVRFCRERFRRPNFVFDLQPAPTRLPAAAAGPFDAAFFFSVFTHVYPDEMALLLAEVRPRLAPGGFVLADLFATDRAERHAGNRGELFVNLDHVRRLAAAVGFAVEVLGGAPWPPAAERLMLRLTTG